MVDLGPMRYVRVLLLLALTLAGCSTVGSSTTMMTGRQTRPTQNAPATTGSAPEEPPTSAAETIATRPDGTVKCPEKLHPWSLRMKSDLDGDGQQETVAVDRPDAGETTIAVCGTKLVVEPFHVGDVNKAAEVFLLDVDNDGIVELLVGGTTGGPLVFSGTVLRFDRTRWVDLGVGVGVTVVERTGRSFGCGDVDGDGVRELVSRSYTLDADRLSEATRIDWVDETVWNPNGPPGGMETGSYDVTVDTAAVVALLNGTCGNKTIIRAPLQ